MCTIALATLLLLGACAAGVNFVKPSDDQLVFGTTTRREVINLLGEPSGKGLEVSNGENVLSLSYAYANIADVPVFQDITPARSITLYFYNNILVGKGYSSTFLADNTYFDPAKARMVKEGMTKNEVLDLLGKSSGEFRYPLISSKNGKALVYTFTQTKGDKTQENSLVVELDENDNVRYSEFNQHAAQ